MEKNVGDVTSLLFLGSGDGSCISKVYAETALGGPMQVVRYSGHVHASGRHLAVKLLQGLTGNVVGASAAEQINACFLLLASFYKSFTAQLQGSVQLRSGISHV